MLVNILSNLDGNANTSFGVERPVVRACQVVVTSNRGLAGAFNSNVIKAAVANINGKFSDVHESGKLTILCIGKKGYEYFAKRYPKATIISDYVELFNDLTFDNVATVSQMLMSEFSDGDMDAVDVAYCRFKNAAVQFAENEQWLPVAKLEEDTTATEEKTKGKADYIFEPSQEALLEYLVPSILKTTFQKYLLDTHASEHGARMTAMDKATENADELLKGLKISYNKARQEAITNEILEIVGGAAALEEG
jgi:F-type H+-transporting ATPase subunit gamma